MLFFEWDNDMKMIKKFILKHLDILMLKEFNENVQNKNIELENRIRELEIQNKNLQEIVERIDDIESLVYRVKELDSKKRKQKLVVSLTSFPARIEYVHKVIERMLLQTLQPDEIVLWLSRDQFPREDLDLPQNLIEMKKYGVKIEWCDGDIKAYKKFLPAFKKFENEIIVIIDDDLIYPINHLEKLYEAHLKFPDAIIASRVHQILYNDTGILPYKMWKKECEYDKNQIRNDWFFTGGAGTLFPIYRLPKIFFDEDVIQAICPLADDIWLNIHASINHIPIVNTAVNANLKRIEGTQLVCLEHINVDREMNDTQLKAVVSFFEKELKGSIYEKLRINEDNMKKNLLERPKISVVVIVPQMHNYLRDCLNCLINQSLSNIEIICINNEANGAEDIIAEYVEKYENMKVINQTYTTKAAMRNVGLKEATGKYIYYMESSDLLLSTALEDLWKISEDRKLDLLYFSGSVFSNIISLKNHIYNEEQYYIAEECQNVFTGKEVLQRVFQNGKNIFPLGLQLIRREFLNENSICHLGGNQAGEDLFGINMLMKAKRCFWLSDVYVYFRIFEDVDLIRSDNMQLLKQLKEELAETKRLFRDMENSKSFKIGRVITAIPRGLRDLVNRK